MSKHDWVEAYRLSSATMHQALTEEAFVAKVSAVYGPDTTLRIQAAGALTYSTGSSGLIYAREPLTTTTTKAGKTTTSKPTITMILTSGGWRCLSAQ
jgi:hypothetical protein